MSRPSATRPGGSGKAPLALQQRRAHRRQGGHLGGVVAGLFGADLPGHVPAAQPDDLLPRRRRSRNACPMRRRDAQAPPRRRDRCPPGGRPGPPADTAPRCRAARQPSALATARLTVPLPEPEGPSMVRTGTSHRLSRAISCTSSPTERARSTKPGNEVATLATSRIWIGPGGAQAGDAEGHGDAVIAAAVDLAAAEGRASGRPCDPHAVGQQPRARRRALQARRSSPRCGRSP